MSKESGPVSMAAKGIARPAKAAAALSLCFTMTGVNAQDHPSERPAGDSGALATAVPEGMWEDSPATAKEQETGGLPGVEPQAETLDSLVVSATRIRTPASELTQSVTVVAGEEIAQQKRIDRNVGEILSKSVPGFSQSTEGLTDFGQTLRGRTFLTLIDGVPMSTPLRDGRRSLNTIDADAIERIEVVRGGTAVYGFGASGGLVNIITREPEAGPLNGRTEAGLKGSTAHPDDSLEWHASNQLSGHQGSLGYLLDATVVQRNSFFDAAGDRIPADPFGVQGGLADTDEYNVLSKTHYELGHGRRIGFMANYFSIFQDSDHAGVGNGDPATRTKTPAVEGNINVKDPGTENALINLQYQDNDLWGSVLRSQLYYNDLLTRFAKFPGFDQVEIRSEKLGARATIDTPLAVGSTTWNALWGVDYLHDRTRQPSLDGPTTTPEMVQDAGAVFLQLEAPAGAWGLLRGGVRHEYITVDIDSVTNRQDVFVQGGRLNFNETLFNLSGILYLTDRLELFGGYSQGFSLADLGRAIADTTETDVEALESEVQTVDNYELGLRTVRSRWDASLAVFYNESENGTTFNQALEIVKQPERVYGIELATNLKLVERVQVGGTATWMEGEVDLDDDGDYDEDLPSTRVPPLKVTAYTEYRPYHWWSLRLQGLYSGERSPESSQFGGAEVEDYTLLDLYSGFELPRGRLEIGIENLINEDYFTVLSQAGALPYAFSKGPGRTISATYSLAW